MTTLLVANVGGHLTQLHALRSRLPLTGPYLWVTSDTAQSRSLLHGEDVVWLDYPQSRSAKDVLLNTGRGVRRLPRRGVTTVVSTGANLAVSILPLYAAARVPCHYIESATRVTGPSTSGRIISALPGVRLYSQYRSWSGGRWRFGGTVFDGYEASAEEPRPVRRVVVTLGSSEGYGFRRALERLIAVLPADVEVLWQTGVTDVTGLDIDARPSVPGRELQSAIAEADAVIAHAGTGSSLVALEAGHVPLLLPRRIEHREHVDAHQPQIAGMLAERGLAVVREADEVTWQDVVHAAAHHVRRSAAQPFALRA